MAVLVGIIMGSRSDWETMRHAAETLDQLGVPHEVRVVSAHRTPDLLFEYAGTAESRGLEVIIAGAGGAAHLPGICTMESSESTAASGGVGMAKRVKSAFSCRRSCATARASAEGYVGTRAASVRTAVTGTFSNS